MCRSTKLQHSQSHPCQRRARCVACKLSASSHLTCALLGERCSASSKRQIAPALLQAQGHGKQTCMAKAMSRRTKSQHSQTTGADEHVALHVSYQLPYTSPAQCLANGAQRPANGKAPRHCYRHGDMAYMTLPPLWHRSPHIYSFPISGFRTKRSQNPRPLEFWAQCFWDHAPGRTFLGADLRALRATLPHLLTRSGQA